MNNILVTGAAGFIGSALSKCLIQKGYNVIGIDNINSYYDVRLKHARLEELGVDYAHNPQNVKSVIYDNFEFYKVDISDSTSLNQIFDKYQFDVVVNLAAQAGVRYSITNPEAYIQSNLVGFANILECCRNYHVSKLVYASSSSVYGSNQKIPFEETDKVDNPVSLYAATKKSNELMAYSYSKLYGFKTIGLRYFTVYGPWGRPDMAPMLFAKSILNNAEIRVFNNGDMQRDFTYIDDIVEGTYRAIISDYDDSIFVNSVQSEVFNIGNGSPIQLMDFIACLEKNFGKPAIKKYEPMQQGDVYITYANTKKLQDSVKYKPEVNLDNGIKKMALWYLSDKNPLLN